MKIKSLILVAILALFSTSAFAAKDASAKEKDPLDATQIQPFDFKKLFDEAEKNFQIAKAWQKIKCEPKTGFICTKRECAKRDISTHVILDKKKETVTRCDKAGCETFTATFKQTGVFFNIQSEGPIGTLIRVFGDSRYKEITTVGLDAYIANGNCEVID